MGIWCHFFAYEREGFGDESGEYEAKFHESIGKSWEALHKILTGLSQPQPDNIFSIALYGEYFDGSNDYIHRDMAFGAWADFYGDADIDADRVKEIDMALQQINFEAQVQTMPDYREYLNYYLYDFNQLKAIYHQAAQNDYCINVLFC